MVPVHAPLVTFPLVTSQYEPAANEEANELDQSESPLLIATKPVDSKSECKISKNPESMNTLANLSQKQFGSKLAIPNQLRSWSLRCRGTQPYRLQASIDADIAFEIGCL